MVKKTFDRLILKRVMSKKVHMEVYDVTYYSKRGKKPICMYVAMHYLKGSQFIMLMDVLLRNFIMS